jgi:hypothetical protein
LGFFDGPEVNVPGSAPRHRGRRLEGGLRPRSKQPPGVTETFTTPFGSPGTSRPREPHWSRGGCQFRRLTPREMTSTDKTIAETDSAPINSLARCDSGMVSVGLKADEFVIDTYK